MELTLFWLATLLTSVVTLVPLSKSAQWWVRDLDFPRLQFSVVIGLVIILGLWRLDLSQLSAWLILSLNTAYFVYQLWWIAPYTRLYPKEAETETQTSPKHCLKLLNANVLATNRHAKSLLELVKEHQPDILITLESNLWWQQQLAPLAANYPYCLQCPLENLYGMHLYSRLPLHDGQIRYLVEKDVPSMHCLIEVAHNIKVQAHFLHPAPPSPSENDESAPRDAELVMVAKSVKDAKLPVLVAGDLNDVAWSRTTRLFRKISGLLDPRIGRGMFNTFNAKYPLIRWPLDHLFHSRHFKVISIKRLSLKGSDHFSLLTVLSLHPHHTTGEAHLNADQEDKQQAKETLAAEDVSHKEVPIPE